MRGDILRRLIEAHAEGDDASFRKAALQLAAAESAAGHARIADELRMLVARLPPEVRPEPGAALTIGVDPTRLRLFDPETEKALH